MSNRAAFLDIVVSQPWVILESRADEYIRVISQPSSPETLEAYRANQHPRGERMGIRDGVAILNVEGPLFKKANLFVEFCGATSYEILRRDLQAALDDPAVKSILLNIDSPGGEANGCDELARAIYQARGKKPITAYVSGMAASGGYWIASAADRVVISELAVLGSIGVVLGVEDRSSADERRGVRKVEIVSSQSPGKRPDVNTEEGRTQIQTMVDDLAEVFVSAVAKHRGVSSKDVISKFGAGGVKIGAKAVAAGMADEVGQFEAVLSSLKQRSSLSTSTTKGSSVTTQSPAFVGEMDRIRAITSSQAAQGYPDLAHAIATKTTLSPTEALILLEAAAKDTGNNKPPAASDPFARVVAQHNKNIDQQTKSHGAPEQSAPERVGSGDPFAKAVARHNRQF
jgi:signal peptide peptidase SppA